MRDRDARSLLNGWSQASKEIGAVVLGTHPRRLLLSCRIGNIGADLVEKLLDVQSGRRHMPEKGFRENPIVARPIRRRLARIRRIDDDGSRRGAPDHGQAPCRTPESRERIVPAGIQHDDVQAATRCVHGLQDEVSWQGPVSELIFALDIGIDRYEVVHAVRLDPVAGVEEQSGFRS